MKKSRTYTAIIISLGIEAITPMMASAATQHYNWAGIFTMLYPDGGAVANTSINPKFANQFQTPVSGTMTYDTVTGAGSATIVPFDFLSGSLPMSATSINVQSIGDGFGGEGNLVMGNMLFNWESYGIPFSIVLDAAGFFSATPGMWSDGVLDQSDVAAIGAIPASDGTYVIPGYPYLNIGPVPMATTEWNLTRAAACGTTPGSCLGVSPSGVLPLVMDTAPNTAQVNGDGYGVGGVPVWDGEFAGVNINFDITSLTAVPVPATVWLFGSGLLGLIGISRRKRSQPNRSSCVGCAVRT